MGAVESDSVKSARKAKDKLHKACQRVSETRERTLHGQEVAIITCIAAPRVWHFSAFHLEGSCKVQTDLLLIN